MDFDRCCFAITPRRRDAARPQSSGGFWGRRSRTPKGGDPGALAWGSGPNGEMPVYTDVDFSIARDGKIAALYVYLDPAQ
jgi:hypothetical protein